MIGDNENDNVNDFRDLGKVAGCRLGYVPMAVKNFLPTREISSLENIFMFSPEEIIQTKTAIFV